jgi:hypothetical protein
MCFGFPTAATPYPSPFTRLGLETLDIRRLRADMTLLHNAHASTPGECWNNFFAMSTSQTRAYLLLIQVPATNGTARKHFVWWAARVWNGLPEDIVLSDFLILAAFFRVSLIMFQTVILFHKFSALCISMQSQRKFINTIGNKFRGVHCLPVTFVDFCLIVPSVSFQLPIDILVLSTSARFSIAT